MKTLTGSGRLRNPDDLLDPNFNPNEEPSYREAEPDDEPLPDRPLEVPPPITPLTMFTHLGHQVRNLEERHEAERRRQLDPKAAVVAHALLGGVR